tara:strand:- start:1684 stop:1992 length:309 start_codon:yes stop_codon:yes gene_type:complete
MTAGWFHRRTMALASLAIAAFAAVGPDDAPAPRNLIDDSFAGVRRRRRGKGTGTTSPRIRPGRRYPRSGIREETRRLRQIASGQLREQNGLVSIEPNRRAAA